MVVQGKNALANLLNGADPPSQGPLVKKDDDGGFDQALGMALFAHPSFVPPPNQITNGARDKVALADEASLPAGPSPSGGDNALRFTDYGVRQSLAQNLAIDSGDTDGPRSPAGATVSFEDLAASLPTDGGVPLAAHSGERQTPAIDPAAGDSPSPSAAVSVSFERFGGDLHSAKPVDDPHGLPVGDPKPLDDPHGLPVSDPKPLVPQSDNHLQSTTGDAASFAPRQAGHVIGSKAPDDRGLNLTVSVAPTSRAQERASHVEAPVAPAFDGSQPKPVAARAHGPAAEKGMAETRLGGQPGADAPGRQTAPVANAQGKSAPSNPIPESIDPPSRPAPSDNDKHGPASRTDSALPASHRFGADNAVAPATTTVSDSGGGASRPAAAVVQATRVIATPAPAAKVANLRIDLAAGQSTHATVRERSGTVDVTIVTPNEQSAQLIGSELPSLRRALDAAGMQLGTADVHHQGGGDRRQNADHQGERPRPLTQSDDATIFAVEEVKQ